jgi:dTMP kinase
MFVVFEGVDRSGKSTLSKELTKLLNRDRLEGYRWTKEPSFTSEQADLLNSGNILNEFERETLFYKSRVEHQEFLKQGNIICDRYIWTGLAYARMFSPKCFEFAKSLYTSDLFIKPDLYIFVDTPIDTCLGRDSSLDRATLEGIRTAFIDTLKYVSDTKILKIESVDSVEKTLENLVEILKDNQIEL